MAVESEHATIIDAPIEVVFDLSLDIDAHLASMAESGDRAIGGVTIGRIGFGETVAWGARHFGIPFTMTSMVTEWQRPHRFVDEQVRGPFAPFHHEHVFEAADGPTTMTDSVRFDAPLGPVGRLVERLGLAATSTSGSRIEVSTSSRQPSKAPA
ncbi:MAG: SRPBCC family protein [Acidimicrobiales bacterium]